jgi:hypothetical protein
MSNDIALRVNKIMILRKRVIQEHRLDKANYFIQENITFCLWLTKSVSKKLVTKSSNKIIKMLEHRIVQNNFAAENTSL